MFSTSLVDGDTPTISRHVRPTDVIRWFDGFADTVTVEAVTSDYRQRALRVHTFRLSNGVSIERADDDVLYLATGPARMPE